MSPETPSSVKKYEFARFGTHPRIYWYPQNPRIRCHQLLLGPSLPRAPGVRMTWVLTNSLKQKQLNNKTNSYSFSKTSYYCWEALSTQYYSLSGNLKVYKIKLSCWGKPTNLWFRSIKLIHVIKPAAFLHTNETHTFEERRMFVCNCEVILISCWYNLGAILCICYVALGSFRNRFGIVLESF